MLIQARLGALVVVALLVACSSEKQQPREYEGDEPGECSDGADNDRNGYFDCADKACWGSPACGGVATQSTAAGTGGTGVGGSSTGNGSTSGAGGSRPNAIASHLTAADVSYTVSFDLGAIGDMLCDPNQPQSMQICDCSSTYVGDGMQLAAHALRVTMKGKWTLDSTSCGDSFLGGIWLPMDEMAHHSYHFNASLTQLNDWVVHGDAQAYDPILVNPSANQQFWITDMAAAYDDTTKLVNHQEQETNFIDIIEVTVTHTLQVQF